jgi:uncharacterized membrane protein YfcA
MDQSAWFWLAACLAAFFVGASKGGLQMLNGLGVPLLALVMPPVAAAALLLPVYIVRDMVGLWAYRREYSVRNLVILLPAMFLGVALGWATAKITPEWMVTLLVGLVGIYYCATAVLRKPNAPPKPADVPRGLFWGTISGFASFVSHTGGPPFQTYLLPQKLPKMIFAGTGTIAFAIINVVKLLPYWALGEFNPGNLQMAAMLSPVAIAGAIIGYKLTSVIPQAIFYRIIEVALFLISLKLIHTALFT